MQPILRLILLILSASLLAACAPGAANPGLPPENSSQDDWQTYTNDRYQFSIQYPSLWQVMELPTADYPTATDEVWFVSEAPPPPYTGARADITLVFTCDDPSPGWEPQYFDDYQSDTLWLGDIEARKVSGINKEGLFREIAVLARIGDHYLQAMPNGGEASLENFDRVESTGFFNIVDTEGLITPSTRAKLHFLTDGRPILLSLSAEWLSRQVPLPEIGEQSLEELSSLPETELDDLHEQFEHCDMQFFASENPDGLKEVARSWLAL